MSQTEELEDLIAERDGLQRRIESALRDERQEAYAALAIGAGLIALVLAGAATDQLSWTLALVIAAIIGVITAIAVSLIRAYGLSTVLNTFTPSDGTTPDMDDPLEELRERLAACEQRIARLRREIG